MSRRLRIAVLHRVFSTAGGGAERYAVALAEHLSRDHEVHIWAQVVAHAHPGLTVHAVPQAFVRPRWLNQWWYALYTWWHTRQGYDVVHSHENTWHGQIQTIHVKTVRASLRAAEARRWRRWLRIATSPRLLSYCALEAARMAARPNRVVVAVSPTLADDIAAVYPASVHLLQVAPPGVDLPDSQGVPGRAPWARQSGERWVLLVANDYARKGLDAALQALALLPPAVRLAVAGHKAQAERYQALAQDLGLADRVQFLGPQHDMTAVYAAADVLVHPTLEDSFGMVVLEAMAHGLPVVVSRAPYCGAAALLHDAQHALLLQDPRDAPALAAALARVLDDATLRAQLVAGGRALAQCHTWDDVAAQYQRWYQRCSTSTGLPS